MEDKNQNLLKLFAQSLKFFSISLSVAIVLSVFILAMVISSFRSRETLLDDLRKEVDELKKSQLVSLTNRYEFLNEQAVGASGYFVDKKEGKIWKLYQDPNTKKMWWGEMEFGK